MGKAYVVGVGMTKFEKPGIKTGDYPLWAKEAVTKALDDAKIDYSQVEQVFAGYVLGDSGCGQRAMQEIGLTGIPIFNINNNCSTGATCLYLAKEFVELGKNDCVLVVGFEKMNSGSIWTQYPDRAAPIQNHVNALSKMAHFDKNLPNTPQIFGIAGMEHIKKYGITIEQLAKVACKNRKHGVNNPYAQFQTEYTVDEILSSPKIFGPLTRLQCCPTTDGAAAAVIASERFVKKHNLQSRAIEIVGMELLTDKPSAFSNTSCLPIVGYDVTREAINRLFQNTKRNLNEVQVIELHDSFSTFELILYEALGLCPPGKSGEFVDRGDNTYGGKYVINPSGGLISRGHPFGATGIAQCAELCWQLRNEAGKRQVPGAKLALQHNIGFATAVVVALYQKAAL